MDNKPYASLATAIVKQQEQIVGPLAWIEADHVSGVDIKDHQISINGDGKKIIEQLVHQYETLFGRASVEVCRDAVKKMTDIDKAELPDILQ